MVSYQCHLSSCLFFSLLSRLPADRYLTDLFRVTTTTLCSISVHFYSSSKHCFLDLFHLGSYHVTYHLYHITTGPFYSVSLHISSYPFPLMPTQLLVLSLHLNSHPFLVASLRFCSVLFQICTSLGLSIPFQNWTCQVYSISCLVLTALFHVNTFISLPFPLAPHQVYSISLPARQY